MSCEERDQVSMKAGFSGEVSVRGVSIKHAYSWTRNGFFRLSATLGYGVGRCLVRFFDDRRFLVFSALWETVDSLGRWRMILRVWLAGAEELVEQGRDEEGRQSDYDNEKDGVDHETRLFYHPRRTLLTKARYRGLIRIIFGSYQVTRGSRPLATC